MKRGKRDLPAADRPPVLQIAEAVKMYIVSAKLTDRIAAISREAAIQSDNALELEEYVAVPCFGQIVLRYMLNRESFTLEDLDRYETLLNNIAGQDFFV